MARGGRGGGSRNPANQPREVQVSRKVSWLLRHGASSEGLKLGKAGYVSVADALNTRALKSLKITFEELKEVVAKNDKQRFSMIQTSSLDQVPETEESSQEAQVAQPVDMTSDDPKDYLIRANQGHSIKVDTEGLLTPITQDAGNVPATVVHGTDERAWSLILKGGGLRRMTRNHIHFASGLPAGFKSLEARSESKADESTAGEKDEAELKSDTAPVISGMRMSSTVLIYIDIDAALDRGIPFFVSENGVILTEGNEQGVLPYEFFKRVESRKGGGGVLMSDGKLPEGVVVDVEEWEKEMRNVGGKRGGRGGRRGRGGDRVGKPSAADDSRDLMAGVE
jgi:2'-phosphotransferase